MLAHTMAAPFIKTFNYLQCVFFFYMPWFFYKSGMFFKADDDWKTFTQKKYERLIKPFIFFSLIGEPLLYLDLYTSSVPLSNWYQYIVSLRTLPYIGNFAGNPPCWYLLSLFVIFIAYNLLLKKINAYVLSIVLFGVLLINHFYNPFPIYSVTHTVSGCLFFALGLALKELQYKKQFFIVAFLAVLLAIPFNSFVGMCFDLLEFGNYVLWFPFSLCAIIVINNAIKYVPQEMFISKFFVWVGQNSMLLLVTHWLILIALKIVFLNFDLIHETWQFSLISMISIAITTPLLKQLISKIKFIKL